MAGWTVATGAYAVEVSVDWRSSAGGVPPKQAILKIQATDREGPLERSIPVPWRGYLDIGQGQSITAVADGFWAPNRVVDSEVVELELRPLGTAHFSTQTPRGSTLETIRAQFRETPKRRRTRERFVAAGDLPCRAIESRWSCDLPAGVLDLRLTASGLAPGYRWSVDVTRGANVDLGDVRLEAGASLAGWVDLPSSDVKAEIRLMRSSMDIEPSGVERERRRSTHTFETSTEDRGFFQLTGLPLGSYQLTAGLDGWAPSEISDLQFPEAVEYLLEPITLEPWAQAEVWLEPPMDPYGNPWEIRVLRPRSGSHVLDLVAEGFSREGRWAVPQLSAGDYMIEVADEVATWHSEPIEILAGPSEHWIVLEVVPVRGSVTVGDDPIKARVVFGGQAKPRLAFESDEEGRFEGLLPREGPWAVDLRFGADGKVRQTLPEVNVEIADGKTYAEVNIRVPDTRIMGRVEEAGQPVPEALVLVKRREGDPNGGGSASLRTDEEGRFEAYGLEPGGLALRALRDASLSSWILVDLQEDQPLEDLVLQLERQRTVVGSVVYRGGGVPGVLVAARATGEGFLPWTAEGTTAVDGGFSLEVPADTDFVDLLVLPPGFGITMERVDLRASGESPRVMIPVTTQTGTLRMSTRPPLATAVLVQGPARVDVTWLRKVLLRSGQAGWDQGLAWTPGLYRLCLEPGPPEACGQGQLVPGGDLFLLAPPSPDPGT